MEQQPTPTTTKPVNRRYMPILTAVAAAGVIFTALSGGGSQPVFDQQQDQLHMMETDTQMQPVVDIDQLPEVTAPEVLMPEMAPMP